MDNRYPDWLRRTVPSMATYATKLSELRRIEREYGDLDQLYDEDELAEVLDDLQYSAADAQAGRENPSRLHIDGDIRNNLASYKSALSRYIRFRREIEDDAGRAALTPLAGPEDVAESRETFSLEKDMQAALRRSITQLEAGLEIIDGGAERKVPSGFIDILARDAAGRAVVIELKAVKATRDAIGQMLAYMGDISDLPAGASAPVRGILVAPEFDHRALSASRVVPHLTLMEYSFSFTFHPAGTSAG